MSPTCGPLPLWIAQSDAAFCRPAPDPLRLTARGCPIGDYLVCGKLVERLGAACSSVPGPRGIPWQPAALSGGQDALGFRPPRCHNRGRQPRGPVPGHMAPLFDVPFAAFHSLVANLHQEARESVEHRNRSGGGRGSPHSCHAIRPNRRRHSQLPGSPVHTTVVQMRFLAESARERFRRGTASGAPSSTVSRGWRISRARQTSSATRAPRNSSSAKPLVVKCGHESVGAVRSHSYCNRDSCRLSSHVVQFGGAEKPSALRRIRRLCDLGDRGAVGAISTAARCNSRARRLDCCAVLLCPCSDLQFSHTLYIRRRDQRCYPVWGIPRGGGPNCGSDSPGGLHHICDSPFDARSSFIVIPPAS
jgi:hypothetical protein